MDASFQIKKTLTLSTSWQTNDLQSCFDHIQRTNKSRCNYTWLKKKIIIQKL
jgi:hypothetical protein